MIALYIILSILVIIIITLLIMNNRSSGYKYYETFYYDERNFNTTTEEVNTVNTENYTSNSYNSSDSQDGCGNQKITKHISTNIIYSTSYDDKQIVAKQSGLHQVISINGTHLHNHFFSLFFNDDKKSIISYIIIYDGPDSTPSIPPGKYTSMIITGSGRYENITGTVQIEVDSTFNRKITIRYNYI
jgi:hypothetical protein